MSVAPHSARAGGRSRTGARRDGARAARRRRCQLSRRRQPRRKPPRARSRSRPPRRSRAVADRSPCAKPAAPAAGAAAGRRARRASRISPTAPSSAATTSPPSRIATKRVEQKDDPKAMTLLGELYANGYGVDRDDKKAAEWYRLAADRGDREAMFALAMFRLGGRAGPRQSRGGAPSCSPPPPSSAMRPPPTISACSISKASCSRRISRAPPSCSAAPRRPAARKRNTRSPPSTRRAAACRRTRARRRGCMAAAALADYTDAAGRIRDRAVQRHRRRQGRGARPPLLLRKAAAQGQPDRAEPARQHSRDRPRRCRPIRSQAIKWHLIAKAGGASDICARRFMQKQKPESAPPARRRRSPGSRRSSSREPRLDVRRCADGQTPLRPRRRTTRGARCSAPPSSTS